MAPFFVFTYLNKNISFGFVDPEEQVRQMEHL